MKTAIGRVNAISFLVSDLGCAESICVSLQWLRFFLDESPRRRQARTERPRPGFAPPRAGARPTAGCSSACQIALPRLSPGQFHFPFRRRVWVLAWFFLRLFLV